MAQAQFQAVLNVDFERLYQVITQYEKYPEFVDGCNKVKILKSGKNENVVEYHIHLLKELSYTLTHRENPDSGRVEWELLKSDFLTLNKGFWQLKKGTENETDKTHVEYQIEIDFKFPVPGFILNRLIKGSLPSMVKNYEERAKSER